MQIYFQKQTERKSSVVNIFHATTVSSIELKIERRTCLMNKRI